MPSVKQLKEIISNYIIMESPAALKPKDDKFWIDGTRSVVLTFQPIDNYNELFGSFTPQENVPPYIGINKHKENGIAFHNGVPFDENDIKRLMFIGDSNYENHKGTSVRGSAMRGVMERYSLNEEEITIDNIHEHSFIAFKPKHDMSVRDLNSPDGRDLKFKKNEYAFYFIFKDFKMIFIGENNKKYEELVEYLNKIPDIQTNGITTMFHLPNIANDETIDRYHLRFIFNRYNCTIMLYGKDITQDKPGKFLDIKYCTMSNIKHLNAKIVVRKIGHNYYAEVKGKLTSVNNTTEIQDYIRFNTQIKKDNKSTMEDWKIGKPDGFDDSEEVYECEIEGQSGQEKLISRCEYYGPHNNKERPGITPYIGNQALGFEPPNKKHSNHVLKSWMKGLVGTDRTLPKNDHVDNKYTYPSTQLYQIDLIEKHHQNNHLINRLVKKSDSCLVNSGDTRNSSNKHSIRQKTFQQSLPFLFTLLLKTYVWDKKDNIEKLENIVKIPECIVYSSAEVEAAEKRTQDAEKKAEKMIADTNAKAEEQAKKDREAIKHAKELAQKREKEAEAARLQANTEAAAAKKDREAKKQAEEQAKKDQEAKTQAEEQAKKDQEAKKQAEEQAKKAEEQAKKAREAIQQVNEKTDKNITDAKPKTEDKTKTFTPTQRRQLWAEQNPEKHACLLCNQEYFPGEFEACHIRSNKQHGITDIRNGIIGCRYCNQLNLLNPSTFKRGMGETHMITWLRETYPERVQLVIDKLTSLGKDISEV
jgi:hypothetical protein